MNIQAQIAEYDVQIARCESGIRVEEAAYRTQVRPLLNYKQELTAARCHLVATLAAMERTQRFAEASIPQRREFVEVRFRTVIALIGGHPNSRCVRIRSTPKWYTVDCVHGIAHHHFKVERNTGSVFRKGSKPVANVISDTNNTIRSALFH